MSSTWLFVAFKKVALSHSKGLRNKGHFTDPNWPESRPKFARKMSILGQLRRREEGQSGIERQIEKSNLFSQEKLDRLNLWRVLEGHQGCVNCLQWNRKGNLLASGSDDLKVREDSLKEEELILFLFPFWRSFSGPRLNREHSRRMQSSQRNTPVGITRNWSVSSLC